MWQDLPRKMTVLADDSSKVDPSSVSTITTAEATTCGNDTQKRGTAGDIASPIAAALEDPFEVWLREQGLDGESEEEEIEEQEGQEGKEGKETEEHEELEEQGKMEEGEEMEEAEQKKKEETAGWHTAMGLQPALECEVLQRPQSPSSRSSTMESIQEEGTGLYMDLAQPRTWWEATRSLTEPQHRPLHRGPNPITLTVILTH